MSRTSPVAHRRPWWRRGSTWLLILCASGAALAALAVAAIERAGIPPRLLAPYIERRSSGHNVFVETTGRLAAQWLHRADRGDVAPRTTYPPWALPPALAVRPVSPTREVVVTTPAELVAALDRAQPGDMLNLLPGTYRLQGRSVAVRRPGRADAPIVVRAARPGSATLELAMLEGFHVSAPHWIFENLTIVGACGKDDDCEHAFHVVGPAQHVVIRHNEIRDFNAHIKINGEGGLFPDLGQVLGNRLFNTRPRRTARPVTPLDLVAASGWHIEGNFIADFVKDGGDRISYGAFAKGGGAGNRFVRNVVLCEHRLRGAPGRRVGLSFGGGGTGRPACRDGRCVVEHDGGLMRDNLVASCSDDGIYLNRSARTQVVHNTLLDTAGINLRFAESSAELVGNLVDGPVRVNAGAIVHRGDNRTAWLPSQYLGWNGVRAHFDDALELDLRWRDHPPRRQQAAGEVDLCGRTRPALPAFGAFERLEDCPAAPGR